MGEGGQTDGLEQSKKITCEQSCFLPLSTKEVKFADCEEKKKSNKIYVQGGLKLAAQIHIPFCETTLLAVLSLTELRKKYQPSSVKAEPLVMARKVAEGTVLTPGD